MLPVYCNSCVKLRRHKRIPVKNNKIIPVIAQYSWEGINYQSEKDDWKKMRKIIQRLILMFCMLEMIKYILLSFHNITQSVKDKLIF